jgi:Xaa-Pro aminopeptidase
MIKQKEFARRRKQLMGMTGEGSMILLAAAPARIRNGDADYPFRQNSDFYYLTGLSEPKAVLVLIPGRPHGESLMFCRETDPDRETWDGPMAGLQGVVEEFGMDDAFPIDDIDDILPNLIEGRERLYYTIGSDQEFDHQVIAWVNQVRDQVKTGARPPEEFITLDHVLHDMRVFKGPDELNSMGRAAAIACKAHCKAMQVCRPGLKEYQIAAELMYVMQMENAVASYQPIVGGGSNACVLHYVLNRDPLRDGDLLLIDAGAEYDHYASDVSRTFPVNGRFSGPQRDLYEIVLQAQLDAIDEVRPGKAWSDPHHAAAATITRGLLDLGILKGSWEELVEVQACKPYYMHKTGHWLGMDVHDVGDYQVDGRARELEAGMVTTVEPGIYIAPGATEVQECYRGIGIRIEDDVAVTRDGNQVLSFEAPKTLDEIEQLMAG